ncbi:MAG: LysR family substrate-binding domain-containing protein, partial [Syntrophales bacterium]|nr:LysR family substrate-binding domain-containing protein [Syntrophales bacterium]
EMNTAQQIEALQEGRIHVGFLRPPRGVGGGIVMAPVFREPLVAVVPTHHRLQGRRPLALRELAGEPFIMVPRQRGPGYFDYIISLCRREGFSPFIVLEASQFHTIIGLVAAGLGVSIVPATMRLAHIEGVDFIELAKKAETVLEMAWREDSPSRVLQNFLAIIRELHTL